LIPLRKNKFLINFLNILILWSILVKKLVNFILIKFKLVKTLIIFNINLWINLRQRYIKIIY